MFALVISIHLISCTLLILIVLVQQGRGGGLIDSFSSAESIFGTKTNDFLVKSTSVLATVFFLTCLSLAFLSLQKGKSLVETRYRPETQEMPAAAPAMPALPQAPAATSQEPAVPETVPAAAPEAAAPTGEAAATPAPAAQEPAAAAQNP
ncbi:MAG: preprotein translocase subunit SecG [Deltaproteobacteria bacterium]